MSDKRISANEQADLAAVSRLKAGAAIVCQVADVTQPRLIGEVVALDRREVRFLCTSKAASGALFWVPGRFCTLKQ